MGRKPAKVLELDMSFEEALERFIQVDPAELVGRPVRLNVVRAKTAKSRKKTRKAGKPAHSKGLVNSRTSQKTTGKKGARLRAKTAPR